MLLQNNTFKFIVCAFVLLLVNSNSYAQSDAEKEKFHWLNISGFVAHSVKYDTRQTINAREGELLLYPTPIDNDVLGVDKNGFGTLSMFNLHSRMSFNMTAPEFYGFKTTSRLEFDFFGSTNNSIATARIRHAYIKIQNNKIGIILGQTWHPAFFTDCFPDVVVWGAAIPTAPFNRSPQVRLTYTPIKEIEASLSALSQRDFPNYGPNGRSGEYLRNSGIPEMQLRIIARFYKGFSMGAVAGYKTIVPRMQTDSLLAVKESLSSYNISAFAKYKNDNFYIKAHAIYGQNLSHLMLIGGYGVSSIDTETDIRSYENYRSASLWSELAYKINNLSLGFYAGIVSAPDNKTKHESFAYGLGTNMESLIRWSPRVVYEINKLKFAFELAATTANYLEQTIEDRLIPAHTVTNYRYVFTTLFKF